MITTTLQHDPSLRPTSGAHQTTASTASQIDQNKDPAAAFDAILNNTFNDQATGLSDTKPSKNIGNTFHVNYNDRMAGTSRSHVSDVSATHETGAAANEEISFMDFLKGILDVVNPLQHIPVINTVYRHFTGDEISDTARFAGGALYGGPIGAAVAGANIAFAKTTGKDMGDTVMAMMTGDDAPQDETPIMVAAADLDKIETAAGTPQDKIIWNDDILEQISQHKTETTVFSSSPTPTSYHTGTGEIQKPAVHSLPYTQSLASIQENGSFPSTGLTAGEDERADQDYAPRSMTHTVLAQQDAPAEDPARTAVPPELIASQMMLGLDKYTALKSKPTVASVSASY